MSFAGRLVLGTFTVVVLTLLVLVWGAERTLRRSMERDVGLALEREARLVADLLPSDTTGLRNLVDRVARQEGHRIVVRDTAGTTLMASDSLLGDRVLRVEAPAGGRVVTVAAPLDSLDATVTRARRSMTAASVLALLVALGLAFVAGRSIARPIADLSVTARAISQGTAPRFPRSRIREVDALATSLRQMHRDLDDRFDDLQREKSASTAIVDAMTDGIIAADARGRIALANRAARQVLGYAADAPLPDLRTLFRVRAARGIVAQVLDGESVTDREVELDGRIVSINARSAGEAGVVLILRDQTDLRRLESIRRDFVANVSHELKTPLTSISGYAETLAADEVDLATRQRFLRTILDNAHRMQRLVDDLLDLSRVESGRWTPEVGRVALDGAVSEAWAMLADRAAAKGVTLTTEFGEGAGALYADAAALQQILGNLLDNAIRHEHPDGAIVVASRVVADGVEVAVADDGSGIPAEHLPRIFERFYRVDPSRSRAEGGTGLGLSIVRHLVEAHGGRVTAESELRRGTTIRLVFPAQG